MRVPDNGKDASQDTEHRAPAVVETRAVDLLLAALKDFPACQGSVSNFSDLGQARPFVYARPNSSLAVSLQIPP